MARVINGRYALSQSPVGSGGVADVYSAADLGSDLARVAVKIIRTSEDHQRLVPVFFEREVGALRALRHPNIVRLLDAGTDSDSGDLFLVLEWVPSNLPARLEEAQLGGWDDFADGVALPLLEGLAHAHDRTIVHRDVKPSNVLVDERGVPKLADFGISKIKSQLGGEGETVADFLSRPYAPPEHDSSSSYRRDVFAFGVLLLACLSDVEIRDYPDISPALFAIDAPAEILAIIERSVSFEPSDRPENALVLLAEIDAVQARRREKWRTAPTVYLSATKNALDKVAGSLNQAGGSSEESLRESIQEDLAAAAFAERMREFDSESREMSDDVWLYGERWRYHARPDVGAPVLALIGAKELESGRLDVAREHAWEIPHTLVVGHPLNYQTAAEALRHFLEQLSEFHERRELERAQRERERLFGQWRAQLLAKEAAEAGKETPLPFGDSTLSGRRATFELDAVPEGNLAGERRAVRARDFRGRIAGEVERLRGRQLTLYLDRAAPSLPARGSLVVDTLLARIALERQKQALDAVRFSSGGVERDDLRDLVLQPHLSQEPSRVAVEEWVQTDLDDDKRHAVCSALGSPDFFAVEGPPGTGKTTFIAELVQQELKRNPRARVLLASQTHVALDNALERMRALGKNLRMIRLGRASDTRIAGSVEDLLLDHQLEVWADSVRRESEQFMDGWASNRNLDLNAMKVALRLGELTSAKDGYGRLRGVMEQLRQYLEVANSQRASRGEFSEERREQEDQLSEYRAQQAQMRREIDRLAGDLAEPLGVSKDYLIQVGSAEARALMDRLPLPQREQTGQLQALIQLQGEWLERVGRGAEFEAALLYASHVVAGTCVGLAGVKGMREVPFDLCVLDEGSKATATEALVPLVRARRWVLVGDTRQLPPFQEEALNDSALIQRFDLDAQELRRTLFDRLVEGLPESSKTMLTVQHRMVRPIGELVSECFYGGQLLSPREEILTGLELAIPAPVVWLDTGSLPGHRERSAGLGGSSFVNAAEARAIAQRLELVNWVMEKGGWQKSPEVRKLKVMVLSGYRPQVDAIDQKVMAKREQLGALDIEINTVDAAQGREADIAFFSVTRSNQSGSLGFLSLDERVNVALSRGRQALVVVGDLAFCEASPGPLSRVASFVRSHEATCEIQVAEQ